MFVEITARDDQLQKQLGGVQKQLGTMGVAIGSAVGSLAASAIASASSAIANFIGKGISGAVELQDQLSALTAVFGDSASVISGEADRMAKSFGVVKGEFVGAATNFGQMFKGTGSSVAEAAALGNQLTELGMDMKSFKGGMTTNAEVFTVLSAAMRGEYDSIDRFGVLMNAAKVESEALALGLAKTSKEVDDHAKMQARLSLIMKATVDQQGDLSRTADQTGNSWSKFTGTLTNLAVEMGTTLEPAINAIIAVANEMLSGLVASFESSKEAWTSFASTVAEYAGAIGVAWRNLGDVWEIVQLTIAAHVGNFLNILAVIPENVAIIASYIGRNWFQLIYDGVSASMTVFENFTENIRGGVEALYAFMENPFGGFNFTWKPLLDGFAATMEELPELVKPAVVEVTDQIAAITDRMAVRETARIQGLADKVKAAAKPAQAAATAAAAKSTDFKSVLSGASEFALKMRASIYESGNKIPEQQLKAQERTALASETTAAKVGALAFTRLK